MKNYKKNDDQPARQKFVRPPNNNINYYLEARVAPTLCTLGDFAAKQIDEEREG